MYRNWPNRLPLCIIKCKYFNLFSITIGSISVIKEFVKNINCTTINELKRAGKLVEVINVFINLVPSMLAVASFTWYSASERKRDFAMGTLVPRARRFFWSRGLESTRPLQIGLFG